MSDQKQPERIWLALTDSSHPANPIHHVRKSGPRKGRDDVEYIRADLVEHLLSVDNEKVRLLIETITKFAKSGAYDNFLQK